MLRGLAGSNATKVVKLFGIPKYFVIFFTALDMLAEAAIVSGLEEFFRGRTVLVIAHRLSTVRNADSIMVLDRGRSVGQGTHDELMDSCSQYRELVRSQLN